MAQAASPPGAPEFDMCPITGVPGRRARSLTTQREMPRDAVWESEGRQGRSDSRRFPASTAGPL